MSSSIDIVNNDCELPLQHHCYTLNMEQFDATKMAFTHWPTD